MSNERTLLNDDAVEMIAGGNVQYVLNNTDHYCYGSHNPDVKYEFTSRKAMAQFVADNYDYYGEAGIFDAMIAAGIVTPMNNNSGN